MKNKIVNWACLLFYVGGMVRKSHLWILLSCWVVLTSGCSKKSEPAFICTRPRIKVSPFTFPDLRGDPVPNTAFRGKWVVVNLWTTWSPTSAREVTQFEELSEKYRDKGVEIIGIALDEKGTESVVPYVERRGLSYRILIGSLEGLPIEWRNIEAIPTTFIIDPEGYMVQRYSSGFDSAVLQKDLDDLFKEREAEKASKEKTE